MKKFGIIILSFFVLIAGFLLWNIFPPLPKIQMKDVEEISGMIEKWPGKNIKVVTYNIQFGMGLDARRRDRLQKEDFQERLEAIGKVLRKIDADIVLLQEVDFASKRTHDIDQALFLAKFAEYRYIARAPHLKRRLFPSLDGLTGKLYHGLAILSRFPISENEVRVFSHPKEAPFYVRWLYNPHGGQRVFAEIQGKKLAIFNVHLEPWAQKTREETTAKIVSWIEKTKTPFLIGGDFNALCPKATNKTEDHLNDMPFFIDRSRCDVKNDTTIAQIESIPGISEASGENFQKREKSFHSYPATAPSQKLDYLFAGYGARISDGEIDFSAGFSSDHLPYSGILVMPPKYRP